MTQARKPLTNVVVGISGSRTLEDPEVVISAIDRAKHRLWARPEFRATHPFDWQWLHGGAKQGVDHVFATWAAKFPEMVKALPPVLPDYALYHPKKAPLERNSVIVEQVVALIAIWDGQSGGTFDMIKKAAAKGIPVEVEVCAK